MRRAVGWSCVDSYVDASMQCKTGGSMAAATNILSAARSVIMFSTLVQLRLDTAEIRVSVWLRICICVDNSSHTTSTSFACPHTRIVDKEVGFRNRSPFFQRVWDLPFGRRPRRSTKSILQRKFCTCSAVQKGGWIQRLEGPLERGLDPPFCLPSQLDRSLS